MQRIYQCVCVVVLVFLMGCATSDTTKTVRTASEQLLISTSVDRAVADIKLPQVKGHKIKLVDKYFESVDKNYVLSAISRRLLEEGAYVYIEGAKVDTSNAEELSTIPFVVEVTSGGIGTNQTSMVLGVPSMPISVPFTNTTFALPEMAIYKSATQFAVTKLNVFMYNSKTGEIFGSQQNIVGSAYKTDHAVLMLIVWNASNLEENVAAPFGSITFEYESMNDAYQKKLAEKQKMSEQK